MKRLYFLTPTCMFTSLSYFLELKGLLHKKNSPANQHFCCGFVWWWASECVSVFPVRAWRILGSMGSFLSLCHWVNMCRWLDDGSYGNRLWILLMREGGVGRGTRASAETWPGFQGKHDGTSTWACVCAPLSIAAPGFVWVITNIAVLK